MIKLMLVASRRQDMSREDFRTYYENVHAPLAASLMTHCNRYVRNFVDEEISGEQAFDVVTEFWFDRDGPWQEALAQLSDPAGRKMLEEDEARFIDRASVRLFTVRECETPPEQLLGNRS
jgi:uncharacterized protein (TIGR02118 family)